VCRYEFGWDLHESSGQKPKIPICTRQIFGCGNESSAGAAEFSSAKDDRLTDECHLFGTADEYSADPADFSARPADIMADPGDVFADPAE
jgi:hypothetical protein